MEILRNFIDQFPIHKINKEIKKAHILPRFPLFLSEEFFNDYHLSLYPFTNTTPLKYFDSEIINSTLNYLNAHTFETLEAFSKLDREITHAIISILRKGGSWGNEKRLWLNLPKDFIDFEQIWHPEYLRYCEHIYNHLIKIPLAILSKVNRKKYLNLTLSNRINILNENNFSFLTNGYDSIVRNALSHGSFQFNVLGIKYYDNKDNKIREQVYLPNEFGVLFDNLVEACHSMLIAFLLFFSSIKASPRFSQKEITIPEGISFLFVKGISEFTDFQLESFITSSAINIKNQLIISIITPIKFRFWHLTISLIIAKTVLDLNKSKYDRLGLSIDFGKNVTGQVFINMIKFASALDKDFKFGNKFEFFDESINWYDPKIKNPVWYMRRLFASLSWQKIKIVLFQDLRKKGIKLISKRYLIKEITNKSYKKIRRIEICAIVDDLYLDNINLLVNITNHIVRKFRKKKFHAKSLRKNSLFKRKPSYIWIRIYYGNSTLRKLSSFGWASGKLLLHAEWNSFLYRKKPIFVKNPNAIINHIRIKFNPNLYP